MELSSLKGVGPKTINILNNLGIYTKEDLISYYPFRYDIIKRSNIEELIQDDKIIIDGTVESNPSVFYFGKSKNKMSFKINTGSYLMNVSIFNRAFYRSKITIGTKISVFGKYDKIHNTIIANNLQFKLLPNKEEIVPIYHQSSGISSNKIHELINEVNDYTIKEYIPDYLCEKYKLQDKLKSVIEVHNPTSMNALKSAMNYLKYEELFLFMLKMTNLKQLKTKSVGIKRDVDYKDVLEFIDKLPFELTPDQDKCVKNIYDDLSSVHSMNRLIQGDVGSGKTMVAIIALYINYLSNYQGVLMAPTEVLAFQHFNTLKNIFKNYKINIELLTSTTTKKERKEILEKLENKQIDILVGTHALFSNDVIYNNLGLVITDEQHRFGVNQRASLKNKGVKPDILYLSATPIPRTFALTIYGDMDVSSIHTLPSGRKDIKTTLSNSTNIKDVLNLVYEEIKANHQVYVVAPLIEESDKIDLENINILEEKFNKAFSKICKIGVMHGKMDKQEKDKVMEDFKNNKISILISTTVIEVGVDVKNATTMLIFDAYRFGLSQLHQLRGRVGRSDLQSYCVLISDRESERLNIMTKTTDGFKIAEEDFKLRGSGDIFGQRQSGDMNFNMADLKQDYNILIHAKEDSEEVYKNIDNYPNLKELLESVNNLD